MAEFDDEQQDKSKLQEGGEEGARYGGDKLAKKLRGGSEKGAEEAGKKAGKQAGKQAAKRGAQAATAAETAGIGPAVIEAADQAQQAVRDPEKAVKKGGMVILLGIGAVITSVFAVLFVVIAIPIIIIAVLIGAVDIGEAAPDEPDSVLSVTKTANPTQFPNGAEGVGPVIKEVTYTVTITNTGAEPVKDVVISDDCGGGERVGSITSPGQLAPGLPKTITYTCKIRTDPPAYNDRYHINTITVNGNMEAASGGDSDLGCFTFNGFSPEEEETIRKAVAVPNAYPKWQQLACGATLQREDKDPGYNAEVKAGTTVYVYNPFFGNGTDIKTTTDAGRAFVITHELTHVISNTQPVYNQFKSSGICETEGLIRSYPLYQGSSCSTPWNINEDFAEMAGNYIGDREGTIIDFSNEYTLHNAFAENEIFGPAGGAPGEPVTTAVSGTATAKVKIGTPPSGPPAYAPMKGKISCDGGFDFWPTFNPDTTPCFDSHNAHFGIDITSTNIDIFSPFEGSARVQLIANQPESSACTPFCAGEYIVLVSGDADEYKVRLLHLKSGSVTGSLAIGMIIETGVKLAEMGATGTVKGAHLHYEVYVNGTREDPKVHNVFDTHP